MEKTERFKEITAQMADLYEKKNVDYGDSYSKSVEKYGIIAGLTRLSDKFNRVENLVLKGSQMVDNEKLSDTLLDLANYSIMMLMEVEE